MHRTLTDLNRAAVIGSLCLVCACAVEGVRDNPDGSGSKDAGAWNAAQLALQQPIVAAPVANPAPAKVRTPAAHVRTVLEPADPLLERLDLAASWLPPLADDVRTPMPAPEPAFPTCAMDAAPYRVDDATFAAEPEVAGDDHEVELADDIWRPTPTEALAEFMARAVGAVFERHAEQELMEAMAMFRAVEAVASGKTKEQLAREVRGDVGLLTGEPYVE